MKQLFIITEPKSMRFGNGSWNDFEACCDGPPLLRNSGHKGIATYRHGFDGTLFSAMVKRHTEPHAAYFELADLGEDSYFLSITDRPLFVKRMQHSCNNALSWF